MAVPIPTAVRIPPCRRSPLHWKPPEFRQKFFFSEMSQSGTAQPAVPAKRYPAGVSLMATSSTRSSQKPKRPTVSPLALPSITPIQVDAFCPYWTAPSTPERPLLSTSPRQPSLLPGGLALLLLWMFSKNISPSLRCLLSPPPTGLWSTAVSQRMCFRTLRDCRPCGIWQPTWLGCSAALKQAKKPASSRLRQSQAPEPISSGDLAWNFTLCSLSAILSLPATQNSPGAQSVRAVLLTDMTEPPHTRRLCFHLSGLLRDSPIKSRRDTAFDQCR